MLLQGFSQEDFNVFSIEGLQPRMDALKTQIRPKFEAIAEEIVPTLSSLTGDEMFTHIAKHARRKVNPPKDTWVAFANSKRGYKMLPHFQVGLFESHLFIWFAVIYEAPIKTQFAELLLQNVKKWRAEIPADFMWSFDHMKPEASFHAELTDQALTLMFERLRDVKKAELLCGVHISREDPLVADGEKLIKKIEEVYRTVLPLYQLAQQAAIPTA